MKKKRGRPVGAKAIRPGWMLGVQLLAIRSYNVSRHSRTKHTSALQEAVDAVRRRFPKAKFSAKELRRLLASWQPRDGSQAVKVSKVYVNDPRKFQAVRDFSAATKATAEKPTRALRLSFGASERHPRSHVKPPKTSRTAPPIQF